MKNNIKIQKIEAITTRKNYIAGRVRDLVQMRSTKYGAISAMTGCPIFQPRTWNFSNIFLRKQTVMQMTLFRLLEMSSEKEMNFVRRLHVRQISLKRYFLPLEMTIILV